MKTNLFLFLRILLSAAVVAAVVESASLNRNRRRLEMRRRLFQRRIHPTPTPTPYTTTTTTTEPPPPKPYEYAFTAGRLPGGQPDRYIEEKGDEYGVVRGSYMYLGPNFKWHRVNYVADPDTGFHILEGSSGPVDTPAVAAAKAAHKELFDKIARDNAQPASAASAPEPGYNSLPRQTKAVEAKTAEHASEYERVASGARDVSDALPRQTKAVEAKTAEHASEYERVAAEHKRIAEEHARLAAIHEKQLREFEAAAEYARRREQERQEGPYMPA